MVDNAVTQRPAAILAVDLARYSRLMGEDERATVRTLNDFPEIFPWHIVWHRGRVVSMAGEGVFAEHKRVSTVVRAGGKGVAD